MSRKVIVGIAVVFALVMILFPPWMEFYTVPEGGFGRRDLGYAFAGNKPKPHDERTTRGVRIHSSLLSRQLFGLLGATLMLYALAGRFERMSGPGSGES